MSIGFGVGEATRISCLSEARKTVDHNTKSHAQVEDGSDLAKRKRTVSATCERGPLGIVSRGWLRSVRVEVYRNGSNGNRALDA
nr:hypothetical protein CFP56_69063 [Quercus suber]